MRRGAFTLIEVVVALGILALALAGLLAWKPRLAAKPSVALCVAAVIILYSVARNLPCFPFLAPH